MKSSSRKLNVGCGKDILIGFTNLDLVKAEGVDVVHNLNKFPYPFKNNQFNEIIAKHIIEHLDEPEKFMEELWRISEPGGKIYIRTPHYSCGSLSWGDLTHKRTFSRLAMHNYDVANKALNLKSLATDSKMRFKVNSRLIFGAVHRRIGISLFANKFISFYESMLSGLFPAREIIFYLEAVK